MRAFFMIVALLGWAAAARAAQPLIVKAGETVTMTLDDGGRTVEVRRGAVGPLTRFEATSAVELSGGKYDWAVGPTAAILSEDEPGAPPADKAEPGVVTLKLVRIGDKGMMLIVVNGYSGGFKYRAALVRGGHPEATDVCEVMPGKYGFEYWPYLFDSIAISGARRIGWVEGTRPACE